MPRYQITIWNDRKLITRQRRWTLRGAKRLVNNLKNSVEWTNIEIQKGWYN